MTAATALRIFFVAEERLFDAETDDSSSDEDAAAARARLTRAGFSFAAGSVGFVLIMAILDGWFLALKKHYAVHAMLATEKLPETQPGTPLKHLKIKVISRKRLTSKSI
ncbi:MAG TPA: hypothetical protein VGY56_20270 [Verrucomicrobiae bacterium]|nr:hypothetical protein [Verrucomicrobiae bacterium]